MRPRTSSQQGAVAVVVAILAVMLFSVAALAVDLGNAFARKRDVQSQADFAALAGAASLPGTKDAADPAVKAVAAYLNANQPQTDNGASCVATKTCVTAADLVDGDVLNGEIYFDSPARMRVVAPAARVQFGLAAVMGKSEVDVPAEATVDIRSPGVVQPFFLPKGCTSGVVTLKDSSSDPKVTTWTPPSDNATPKIDSVSPLTVPGLTASSIKVYGSKFGSGPTVDFVQTTTGDRIPVDPTASVPATILPDEGGKNVVSATLPPGVYNRPGEWNVRINDGTGYSKSYGTFVVGNPTPPPAGCGVAATGDYGMLDSPRADENTDPLALRRNMAEGLDHDLELFPYPTYSYPTEEKDSCHGLGGTPPPGAKNDKLSEPGNNCVLIQTGMDPDAATDGLILGISGHFSGLLATDTLTGCDRFGGSDEKMRLGVPTNDDVLSCFLPSGVSVGDVTASTLPATAEHSINSKIFESPRFGTVPIIDYSVNPQNGFYPIRGFMPVFITDESLASTHGSSYATSQNGIIIDSGKVKAITVVPINPLALPKTADTPAATIPWLGYGPKIVRLVN